MTTIAAALCWFDEESDALERCASSLAGVADVLVALDGRWMLFPHERSSSPIEQVVALRRAAESAGVQYVAETALYAGLWPSQVAKRAALMRIARDQADWVLVIDADESIESCDVDELRSALDTTELDVARVKTHRIGDGVRTQFGNPRRLYRSSTGVTVERVHNGYRAADGRWLNGDPAYVDLEPELDVMEILTLQHVVTRGSVRDRLDREYSMARRREQVETWAA